MNNEVSFVSEAKQWSFNKIQLIIPLEFKNGSTINVLEYRTAPMKVMVKYDKFVTDSDLISRLINQLTDGDKLNISKKFFHNHSFVRMSDNYTAYRLNVSSYYNETVIDIHSRISKYLTSLKSLKVAIKNKNNYPIHILPIDDKHKFLILPAYEDEDLIPNLAVAALVILILSVIKIEVCAKIKSWQQNALRKRAVVYPVGQETLPKTVVVAEKASYDAPI